LRSPATDLASSQLTSISFCTTNSQPLDIVQLVAGLVVQQVHCHNKSKSVEFGLKSCRGSRVTVSADQLPLS